VNFIPTTPEQRNEMLRACGAASIDELFADIPKPTTTLNGGFLSSDGLSELETATALKELAARNNHRLTSFLGGGFYDHFIPAAVDAVASRSEFYTAYTPYQPELSQGTLQAIYEYQSHICRLTGMEVSNASLYDGGTAIFEACKMALAATGRGKIVVDRGVNPLYRKMLQTHAANTGAEIVELLVLRDGSLNRFYLNKIIDDSAAAVVLQNPNFFGIIDDHSDITERCRQTGTMTIQSVYPLALALIKTPAEQGFDIAVGEGQSLGLPLSFGGPCLGFIGAKKELARRMPGRIAARTKDADGQQGFVLSLQAREQHIRREKATSNICSNQALCALRAHAYLSLLGTNGLKSVAALCRDKAAYLRKRIADAAPSIRTPERAVFNEFIVELPIDADECVKAMLKRGFAAGIPVKNYYLGEVSNYSDGDCRTDNTLLIAVTEKRTKKELDDYADNLRDVVCK
jgi:glycine dehydrogenase subunit 1